MSIPDPLPRTDVAALSSVDRWPGAATARGGRVGGVTRLKATQIYDVLGLPGQVPTAQQASFGLAGLNNSPDQNFQYGMYSNIGLWSRLIGGLGRPGDHHIWVEFHSPATIAALDPTPGIICYTALGSQAGLPAQTGKTFSNQTPAQMGYNVADSIRILIRSDLVTATTANPVGPFYGIRGFTECLAHELGHAAMLCLENMYGTSYLRSVICDIFGRPESEWNPLDIPWASRVVEAAAETFKDIAYPNSLYNNRTNNKITQARYLDFIKLFWGFLETPFWDYTDGFSPFLYQIDNVHLSGPDWTFITSNPLQTNLQFATEAYVAANPAVPNFGTKRPYKWPREGDDFRIHWNWNLPPSKAAQIGDPAGLHPGATLAWGDFDPKLEVKVQLGCLFYPLGSGGVPGTLIDSDVFELNSETNTSGVGEHTVVFPGSIPSDGCDVVLAMSGATTPLVGTWLHPRDSPLYDGTCLPTGDMSAPNDYQRPYAEYTGGVKLARWPLPTIPWPYTVPKPPPGTITIGGGGGGGIV